MSQSLSVCLRVCLSQSLSVCLRVCLSVCLRVCLTVCLSQSLSVSAYPDPQPGGVRIRTGAMSGSARGRCPYPQPGGVRIRNGAVSGSATGRCLDPQPGGVRIRNRWVSGSATRRFPDPQPGGVRVRVLSGSATLALNCVGSDSLNWFEFSWSSSGSRAVTPFVQPVIREASVVRIRIRSDPKIFDLM